MFNCGILWYYLPQSKKILKNLTTLTQSNLRQVQEHILVSCEELHCEDAREVLSYFFKAQGKRIRPALLVAAAKMFNHDSDKVTYLAACIEFIHGASLLHDDVIDTSDQRRGQAAAHEIFGNKRAILAGDLALVLAQENMNRGENWLVIRTCTNCLKEIVEGQVKELSLTGNCKASWADYKDIVLKKTASLFRDSCLVGVILALEKDLNKTHLRNMAEFGTQLGMVFQMVDDILDYSPDREGKTLYSDFLEGKVTGPVILAHQKANTKERLFLERVFSSPDLSHVDEVLHLLEKLNCKDEMRSLAQKHAEEGINALKNLPSGEARDAMEEAMAFCLARTN